MQFTFATRPSWAELDLNPNHLVKNDTVFMAKLNFVDLESHWSVTTAYLPKKANQAKLSKY